MSVKDASSVSALKEALASMDKLPEIMVGDEGIVEVARHPEAVTVVTGIVGCAGLKVHTQKASISGAVFLLV